MGKLDLSKTLKDLKSVAKKHSPEILIGIGITGMVTTTVLAVKATPKALRAIEEKKREVYDGLDPVDIPSQAIPEDVKLKAGEVVKATWKYYIPAAVTCVGSAACIIGASKVSLARNAALATAYNLSQTALNDYKAQVVETIGEKKEKVIREKVAQETVKKDPVGKKEIIITGKGTTRFYDSMGKRRFESDIEAVRKIVNDLNYRMRNEMYISLNDFYSELGLENVPVGDILGWSIDKGLIEPTFDAVIDEDGSACICVDFLTRPDYGYDKYY
ncbi:MAG: hypothetical protein J6B01_04545 [Ruminococcus sp.]|nr:hypothetical protein [Ruminococcus sp.]